MIAVLGSGSWGTALAMVLAQNSTESVLLWGRNAQQMQQMAESRENNRYLPGIPLPENLIPITDMQQALTKVTDILIAVPSHAFCQLVVELKPLLKNHRIVWATKGLEPKDGHFFHEFVESVLGTEQVYGILGGPSFAKEVAAQLPTAVTIAANDKQFSQDLIKQFHNEVFRVYTSDDLIGVQLGGVLKNILAVAAGISDGLGLGANARAAIITRGLAEMMRLGEILGAKVETLIGLAGIGDLVLTCTDDQSRNKRFGRLLAKGYGISRAQEEIGQVVEAVYNAEEIYSKSKIYNIELPIVEAVQKILTGEKSAKAAMNSLLSRKPTVEY